MENASSESKVENQCPICQKIFAEKRYLTKHVNRVHPDGQLKTKKDNSIQCPICKKSFPRFSHVARHQLSCMNIRSFECPFCEEKFQQKAHLLRHVGRKHPNEKKSLLERSVDISTRKKTTIGKGSQPSTSELCQDLVHRHLCIKCGHVFTEKHDLLKHIRNLHHPLVCHHCNRIFYGNAALKKHELMTRTARYTCPCGASFSTIRTLKNHENACRRRGEFICLQDGCKKLFCQRVQLDRHWNKAHFLERTCLEMSCNFEAAGPLKLAAHMEEQHQKKICGYCGEENPDIKHIEINHWKRLKKTVSLIKKQRGVKTPPIAKETVVKEEELSPEPPDLFDLIATTATKEKEPDEPEEEPAEFGQEIQTERAIHVPRSFLDFASLDAQTKRMSQEEEEEEEEDEIPFQSPLPSYEFELEEDEASAPPHVGGSEMPSIFFPAEETDHNAVINLVIQIPQDCTRLILKDHLTNELALAFPELKDSSVLISHDFQGRLLSLFIPISIQSDSEVQKWIHSPIYL